MKTHFSIRTPPLCLPILHTPWSHFSFRVRCYVVHIRQHVNKYPDISGLARFHLRFITLESSHTLFPQRKVDWLKSAWVPTRQTDRSTELVLKIDFYLLSFEVFRNTLLPHFRQHYTNKQAAANPDAIYSDKQMVVAKEDWLDSNRHFVDLNLEFEIQTARSQSSLTQDKLCK